VVEGLSSCATGIGVVVWLAHIVPFALVGNSHSVPVVQSRHSCLLTLLRERLSRILPIGLTYEKVKSSWVEIIESAVRLQWRAALLAVHIELEGRSFLLQAG